MPALFSHRKSPILLKALTGASALVAAQARIESLV